MNEHSSYEISKKLHDKGFRAEHEGVWGMDTSGQQVVLCKMEGFEYADEIPAYTFTELWGAMPFEISYLRQLHVVKTPHGRSSMFYQVPNGEPSESFRHESPAECAAMMVLWLLDNGHIKGEVE